MLGKPHIVFGVHIPAPLFLDTTMRGFKGVATPPQLESKLLVSPFITPIIGPYALPYTTPVRNLDHGRMGQSLEPFFKSVPFKAAEV